MRRRLLALAAPVFAALGVRALRGWFPVRVQGDSMSPTLLEGDLLAVRPVADEESLVGRIVVARSAEREVVKRVVAPPESIDRELLWIEGDNSVRSTDSRSSGPIRRADVVGVVWARYWPPARARRFS